MPQDKGETPYTASRTPAYRDWLLREGGAMDIQRGAARDTAREATGLYPKRSRSRSRYGRHGVKRGRRR
jgi:hypothetical protein